MSSVSSLTTRGRILRQQVPSAPPTYDQTYISQLAAAINDYMTQSTAPGDVVAGRFICSAPLRVPDDVPDTSTFPTGMFYLIPAPGGPAGTYLLTMVLDTAPAARGVQPTNKL